MQVDCSEVKFAMLDYEGMLQKMHLKWKKGQLDDINEEFKLLCQLFCVQKLAGCATFDLATDHFSKVAGTDQLKHMIINQPEDVTSAGIERYIRKVLRKLEANLKLSVRRQEAFRFKHRLAQRGTQPTGTGCIGARDGLRNGPSSLCSSSVDHLPLCDDERAIRLLLTSNRPPNCLQGQGVNW
jgi:hypothetical protein